MPVNTQFIQLVSDLKDEIGQSASVGVGVDFLSKLKRDINRAYRSLYDDFDWPHLSTEVRKPLAAGQRFYDFPTEFELGGIREVIPFWNGQFHSAIERGIGAEQYAVFDSYADVRSDPIIRWDAYFNGTTTQFQVWPIPAGNDQAIYFFGKRKVSRLVNDEDLCLIDDEMVVLFAAIRILKRQQSPDAKEALAEAQARYERMRANTGPAREVRMGMGSRKNPWGPGGKGLVLTVAGR